MMVVKGLTATCWLSLEGWSVEELIGARILQKVLSISSQGPEPSLLLSCISGQAWSAKPPGAVRRAKMWKISWHRLTRSLQCCWVSVIVSSVTWGNPQSCMLCSRFCVNQRHVVLNCWSICALVLALQDSNISVHRRWQIPPSLHSELAVLMHRPWWRHLFSFINCKWRNKTANDLAPCVSKWDYFDSFPPSALTMGSCIFGHCRSPFMWEFFVHPTAEQLPILLNPGPNLFPSFKGKEIPPMKCLTSTALASPWV